LKSRIVLAIVALLVVACECSAQEDADPCGALNDAVNKATDLRGHARYEEAEALYDQTLETAITQDCRFQVARIVFGRGVLAKAEGRLTESLRLLDEGKPRAAADALAEALKLKNSRTTTRSALYTEQARLALDDGRFKEAQSALDNALEVLKDSKRVQTLSMQALGLRNSLT